MTVYRTDTINIKAEMEWEERKQTCRFMNIIARCVISILMPHLPLRNVTPLDANVEQSLNDLYHELKKTGSNLSQARTSMVNQSMYALKNTINPYAKNITSTHPIALDKAST